MTRENYTMKEYLEAFKSHFTPELIPTRAKTDKGIMEAINNYGQLCCGIDLVDSLEDITDEWFTVCKDGVIMWSN